MTPEQYRERRAELEQFACGVFAINPHTVPPDRVSDYLLLRLRGDRARVQIAALDKQWKEQTDERD